MKTEVIIAARGELEVNLKRTVEAIGDKADVCIVFDGMEHGNVLPGSLTFMVRSLELIGGPQGCGWARHRGIMTSDADLIILMDGHMGGDIGKAIQVIQDHHRRRQNHLTCCRMQSLDQHGEPMEGAVQGGAFLALESKEVCSEYWALSAKWLKPPRKKGPIPAIMGACYAFKKSWYEKIGQPLRILRAWGGDEEILSLATHLMGGKVELLPATVGHIYMAAHRNREQTADEMALRWANRYAILEAIPMSEYQERDTMVAWLDQNRRCYNDIPKITDAALDLREVLCNGKVTWEQLKADKIVRPLTAKEQAACLGKIALRQGDAKRGIPPAPVGDKSQIVTRHVEVCKLCGAGNSFRQICGTRATNSF
ncbi:MAG: hypothetical protein ABIH03_10040, partial [Pseudomonadota bacterium]